MKRFKISPLMILVLVLIASNIARGGGFANPGQWIYGKLVILPGIIIGLSFHEFAHGWVSSKLGDPTPEAQGRLTLNPAAHIDPWGFLALIFAGFGWGKPVQIDQRYYRNRRRDELLVSLAGVVMNFILAILFTLLLKILWMANPRMFISSLGEVIIEIIQNVIIINLVLMVFNLLPVPPLDGWGIATQLFKLEKYDWYWTIYNNGFFILMLLIIFNVVDLILSPAVSGLYTMLIHLIL